jgi:hypothetical protein
MLTSVAAVAILLAATPPASVEMPIGLKEDAIVSTLNGANVPFTRGTAPSGGPRLTFARGTDTVTIDLAPWPAPGAPASAYQTPARTGPLTATHVRIAGPSSDAKRRWVRTLERDGRKWGYIPESASTARTAEEKKQYGVAAYMQWWGPNPDPAARARVPTVTFLFQARRPASSPPGTEPTVLDAHLENPWHPRHF